MKRLSLLTASALIAVFAAGPSTYAQGENDNLHMDMNHADMSAYGPQQGDWEMTLGGNGSSDNHFHSTDFAFNGSLGYFLDKSWEVGVRQGVGFGDTGARTFFGSTRGFVDYHLDFDRLRPFIGVNFGGVYGDGVNDSFLAGIEGGAKYYVKPKTFIYGMLEYSWSFDNGSNADDRFSDGQFIYGIGIGFNF